ncbi:MAG: hypothetical protein G01um101448_617 [Parcubacteria group bacterium Gr01-1014_48]|nr:MAG: hypothetical protein Greene041614_455 [Parcubacteria group bacterium Greene0416_14]TSC73728.1 MAG: hypothetical protein G01um101448_617 [Parcubacteria group bacterium Gr01-1014_48]TSD00989.1 MAG: hypothetical protein Greene101415_562 [Parcubacteria group bacterium Greene1014_15]TSD08115.1 MAG: hypothetical protein Greene07144_399 [Parcubacteria group bacterium Greene0714_4]
MVDNHKEHVFCQIAGRDTTVSHCELVQGQEGCFACGAPSRRCEECEKRPIAVPITGRCAVCLTQALKDEASIGKPKFQIGKQVSCQIQKRDILVTTCFRLQSLQGEFTDGECRRCKEPSYLCEEEGCERPVQIRQAGLCLTHAVQELGDGWKPLTENELAVLEVTTMHTDSVKKGHENGAVHEVHGATVGEHPYAHDPIVLRHLPDARAYVSTMRTVSNVSIRERFSTSFKRAQAILSLLEQEGIVGPKRALLPRLVLEHAHEADKRKEAVFSEEIVMQLMSQAEKLVREHGRAAIRFLIKQLHTSYPNAREIMRRLEEKKVIGPYVVPKTPRAILDNAVPLNCPSCKKSAPPARKKTGECRKCAEVRLLKKFVEDHRRFDAAIQKAKNYIRGRENIVTYREIRSMLRLDHRRTSAIIRALQKEGVLGNTRNGDTPPIKEINAHVPVSIEQQIDGLKRLIDVVGKTGDFGQMLQGVIETLETIKGGFVPLQAHKQCVQNILHALDATEVHVFP